MHRLDACEAVIKFLFCFLGPPMYASPPYKICYMLKQILMLLTMLDAPPYHGQLPTRWVWHSLLFVIQLVILVKGCQTFHVNSQKKKKSETDCIFLVKGTLLNSALLWLFKFSGILNSLQTFKRPRNLPYRVKLLVSSSVHSFVLLGFMEWNLVETLLGIPDTVSFWTNFGQFAETHLNYFSGHI